MKREGMRVKLIDTDIAIDHFHGHRETMELADALIAATAHVLGAELVTRNVQDYPMQDVTVIVAYERGKK